MPGQLYGFRVTGPWAPESGHRFNSSKVLFDPYARAVGRRMRWHDSLLGHVASNPHARDTQDSAPWAPLAAVVDGGFAWGDDHPPATPLQDTIIYELHAARLHPAPPGRAGGVARLLPRPGLRAGDRAPEVARRHRRGAPAGPCPRRREASRRSRAGQLLGLQHPRVLRPRDTLRVRLPAARRRPRVQDDGPGAARGRPRGDPRRRLQPHRRRQPPRADARLPRSRQRGLLPAAAGQSLAVRGFHRLRQHAEHAPSAGAAAGDGQPALLGERDAGRRLPLRPGAGARPRDQQLRSVVVVLRRHPPGSDPVAREADRRALGSRRARLPGRPVPGRLVGMERALPGRPAPLLARRSRSAARARHPCRRQQRPVSGRRPPADREHQLRDLSRRLHAA